MPKAAGARLPDNSRISTQWTRRMNSLKLWLTLRAHGRQAYEQYIDRQLELTRSFVEWVERSPEFELAGPTMLTIVNFRIKADGRNPQQLAALHAELVEEVTRDGRRWISETLVNGKSVLRMMVISYLTEERHLRDLENALQSAARSVISRVPEAAGANPSRD
jgi:glutamate/tyrosine decarboxylase-like PLP-dependent enzyme